jgi:hypothetical protein
VRQQVLRRPRDGIGGVVDVRDAVAASVATPLTLSLAGWTGAPPQVLPEAPRMPICIGPAAPNALAPLCTPGSVLRPSSLSTLPMPARITHGTPYRWPVFLNSAR